MTRLVLAIMLCMLVAGAAGADQWGLVDGNSRLDIVPNGFVDGEINWSVDGQDQLYQQWWYYRVGPPAAGATQSISALTLTGSVQPTQNILVQKYAPVDNSWELDVTWVLKGSTPGSGSSDISEIASVTNKGNVPLDLYLFEYNNFDLNGTVAVGDTDEAQRVNEVRVNQWDGPIQVVETVNRTPDFWQLGLYNNVKTQLLSGFDLQNNTGYATGDVAWAFEWHMPLGPGVSNVFSKDKGISTAPIPEWNSLLLAAVGLAGTIGIRRRRR